MLILAGTAISISINGGDIFTKANTAVNSYNARAAEEETKINEVWNILNTMTGGTSGDTNPTPTPEPTKTLSSIEITAQPTKTSYTVGENLDLTGIVVTAIYSDETTSAVTSSVTVTPANGATLSAAGTTTITVNYTEGEVTKTATVTVTVTPAETVISKETTANSGNGYVGYYADMDNDGTVDGIIYADMLVGNTKSGAWNNDSRSTYNVPQIADATTIKDYCISTKTYTGQTAPGKYSANAGLGLKDVIVPATNSTGTLDRFYIMQLSDFTNNSKNSFYWYKEAFGKLNRAISTSTDDFGSGKQNTINMLNDWNNNTATYGEQTTSGDYIDLWGAIQDGQYNLVTTTSDSRKWFVPSKGEWSAFGGELNISKTYTDATYYGKCGLSSNYWASSQNSADYAYFASFHYGFMNFSYLASDYCVRLSATF